MKTIQMIFALTISLILLTACASNTPEPASAPEAIVPATEALVTVASPTSADEAEAAPMPVAPDAEDPGLSEEQSVLPVFSQPITATGEPLVLHGHVLDANGNLLSGYAVEIWQVDADGIYDHPGDSNTAKRDMGFQFYGTSITDENGLFAFRTLVPARYEPRPKHIHFKVKRDGQILLTSQFYFTGEVDAGQLGLAGEMLLLDLNDAQDASGNQMKLAFKDIVLDAGTGGSMTLTPSQVEGPYYPVVDVSQFDNDLASVP